MATDINRRFDAYFVAPGADPGLLRPTRISGREAISALSILEVELVYDPKILDSMAGLLRKTAEVVIAHADGTIARRFSGTVTRVRERARVAADRVFAVVTLESPIALLRYTRDCKLFQEKSAQEIVVEVLASCGIPADIQLWKLATTYPKRDVCTQYDETSLEFVLRVLAEDGIHFFEQMVDGVQKLVFADDGAAHPKMEGDVLYSDVPGLVNREVVTHIFERARVMPAKVTLRDHDFKKPSLDLDAVAETQTPLGREYYDYPGRYTVPMEGKRRAKLRIDAMKARASLQRANSHVYAMAAGQLFTLHDAPRPALDREWLVVAVEHHWEATEGAYQNELQLLASDLPFHPVWEGQRPIVPGPQLAFVTGPGGEEIHCDEFGRVKVQFVWDRYGKADDKSSFWVRVGQMHSSGSVAIPRVGWEVLVAFEDGDPDKPYVLGRTYNGQKLPPASLPGGKTQSALGSFSSPGGGGINEVRTDDGAGSESFAVHAQKDMTVHTANNKDEKVTTSETHQVDVDQTVSIGASQKVSVGAKCEVSVAGAQSWTVGAARTKKVSSDETETIEGSRTQTIAAGHTILTPQKSELGVQGSLTETVAASSIQAAGQEVEIMSIGSASITVGAAMISLCASDASMTTIGARAVTVGGASIKLSGAKSEIDVGGAKAVTVGGVYAGVAGKGASLVSKSTVRLTVGGVALFNGAGIELKVGGSSITIAGGGVEIKSSTIKLTATGPLAELVPMVDDN